MLTLYTSALSGNGRKAMAVARHLKLKVDERIVNVYKGEGQDEHYRKINPWGTIPTLVDDDFVLWESNAILVHLSECHGNNALFSHEAHSRSDILKWLFWESSHWQPALSRVMATKVAQRLFQNLDQENIESDWTDTELATYLSVLESNLSNNNYLCGNTLTLADFSVAGMTTYFYACGFPYTRYPALSKWLHQLNNNPAWRETEEVIWSVDA